MSTRRQFTIRCAGLAMSAAGLQRPVMAQPVDTLRILAGFPPGGSVDNIARRLAERLRGTYAANVIVENKPGAGGQLAVSALKASAPDGATLLLTPPAPLTMYPFTYKSLPYQLEDLVPISTVCAFTFAFAVGTAVPASVRVLKDFLAWARANPAKATFGSPAAGSTPHMLGLMLSRAAGVELTHVPYRGDGPGLQDLMGGQVSGYSTVLGSYLPHLKGERLRLLAVSGPKRSAILPELPTYREQGYPIDNTEWFGAFVPRGTPPATVERLTAAVHAAAQHPEFTSGLAIFGMTPHHTPPQALAEMLRAETEMWRVEIKKLGFSAES